MARKSVFQTLISEDSAQTEVADTIVTAPSRAVQGMRDSLQNLQKSSAQDIPVDQIMDSIIRDRVNLNEGIDDLVGSFERDGQEVPIKVRVVSGDTPYEIVVGRRRLAAAQALGWKHIRGFVVELDDKAMLKALTTENTARLDTSFIGKAQMTCLALEEGHTQLEVGELLGVSQSLVSFMLRVYRGIGPKLINAIGDAPGIGRKKWQTLQKLIDACEATSDDLIVLMNNRMDMYGSDIEAAWLQANAWGADIDSPMPPSAKRFEVLLKSLKEKEAPSPAAATKAVIKATSYLDGAAQSIRKPKEITIKVNGSDPSVMLDYIEARLPEIMKEYESNSIT